MRPGQTLGPYEVVELLGAGGMGEVYRAHDPRLRRDVAIKVLPEAVSQDPERLRRLQREARALAALDHPGVATVHGFEEDGATRFIVMELVEGPTLRQRLDGKPLPLREALDVGRQVAGAVEAAHARGIVHRDLKPENVKIAPDDRVKVLDFGLAKSVAAGMADDGETAEPTATFTATRPGTVLGTGPYMSPEQIRGEPVDQRTDVWAFGCLLFELLTGRQAFPGHTWSDTVAAVLGSEPDWDALPGAVPWRVGDLLRRSLRKDPDRRIQHIGDARIEIEEALEELGSQEGSPALPTPRPPDEPAIGSDAGASEPPAVRRGRRRLLAGVTGIGLALATGAVAWLLLDGAGERRPTDRSIGVLPFEALGQATEGSSFIEGIHGDVLTGLSKISDMRVTSRTSVMRYRDSDQPLPEIARELGVQWILRGEVQEVGGQVQVNARLLDAPEDEQVWAETYRRELTAANLFEIQSELTREIAAALQATLTPEEERAIASQPTEDLDAYRLYVQGRGLLDQRTPEELHRAVAYFQRAIERDPSYALAWSGLADAVLLHEFYGLTPPDAAPEPRHAVTRALELDPGLGVAHASQGILHALRRRGPESVRSLRRALDLRPSYAEAYGWLAWVQLVLGQPERAAPLAERAVELDPLAPAFRAYLAEAYLASGEGTKALAEARRAREIQPDYGLTHFMEGLALHHLGRSDEGRFALERALPLVPPNGTPTHDEIRAALAVTHAVSGNRAAARELLEEMGPGADPFSAALVHAALGETDRAFALFERVDDWWTFSTEHFRYFFPRTLGPLRGDPRYTRILRRVNRAWGLAPDGGIPDAGRSDEPSR